MEEVLPRHAPCVAPQGTVDPETGEVSRKSANGVTGGIDPGPLAVWAGMIASSEPETRLSTVEAALAGGRGRYWRREIGKWIGRLVPVEILVPEAAARWRPLVREAFQFLFTHLSGRRLAVKVVQQFELPFDTPPERRLLRLVNQMPGLQKIGQVLARNRRLPPKLRQALSDDTRAWSKSAVRVILKNPRYTGRQVWSRQRRDEVLLDVDDVAAGHQAKLRWNDPSEWVWSTEQTHEPLVTSEDFATVQERMSAGVHRPTPMKGHATGRRYALSGLVHCAICGRRMQGTFAHATARYRCRYPSEYALANTIEHPLAVFVREDRITPKLDEWIATLFDPAHLDATCEALAMAGDADDETEARAEAARRKLADCDKRLAKYRQALDAGADATVVAGWMAEVQGERLRAEQVLGTAAPWDKLSKEQIRRLVLELRDIAAVLATADPKDKAEVYAELGVRVTYDHHRQVISVSAGPCTTARVGGGT